MLHSVFYYPLFQLGFVLQKLHLREPKFSHAKNLRLGFWQFWEKPRFRFLVVVVTALVVTVHCCWSDSHQCCACTGDWLSACWWPDSWRWRWRAAGTWADNQSILHVHSVIYQGLFMLRLICVSLLITIVQQMQETKPTTVAINNDIGSVYSKHCALWSMIACAFKALAVPWFNQNLWYCFFLSRDWICSSFHLTSVLSAMDIGSLADCRDFSGNFFLDIVKSSSCLHHFLQPSRPNSITWRLRSYDKYPRFLTHTEHDCSFIHYSSSHYQTNITTLQINNTY